MPKGLLSVVAGNTPDVRGAVVDQLLRAAPNAVVLAVSIHGADAGYPVVQRFLSGADPALRDAAAQGATGDPVVILRQDLMAVRRAAGRPHVVLALPEDLDVLPFLVELWRPRVGSGSLGDHYDPAPLLVGVDPESFMADIGCVHRAVRLWDGDDRGDPLTPAEIAARQVEAADALLIPEPGIGPAASGAVALAGHLNGQALLLPPAGAELPSPLLRPAPPGCGDRWRSRLEPVTVPSLRRGRHEGVASVLWRARRPLHPERLAGALPAVMFGVVRSRGHLWLTSRPDTVVTWRSAGAHLELREADRWLEEASPRAWEAATPQRRTLASWFWHDYYGERRNELVFTGIDLDDQRIRSALDAALLTDAELALGREGWTAIPDPLLSDAETS
ncbi:GTP-binding protein [Streptomyces sp. NPDC021622]|uniref:GTP-binding protein n=1 Tax=Streptomyces sp. NPDC021622 TaxID=3155013 RepID=UPI0033C09D8A